MATVHIAIEGNIAAGKTTLAHLLAPHWENSRLALEPFDKNPFLEQFYNDPNRYALALELSFLALRYEQLNRFLLPSLFENVVISDHSLYRSWVFAGITLPESEFVLFEKLYNTMRKSLRNPDVIVKITVPLQRCIEQIKHRNRSFETGITVEYLEKIENRYRELLSQLSRFIPIIEAHIGWVDLINNTEAVKKLANAIKHTLKRKNNGIIELLV